MLKYIPVSILLLILILANPCHAQNRTSDFFQLCNMFFQAHVHDGVVHYGDIVDNPNGLNLCLERMQATEVEALDSTTKKAFWINTYNLLAIKQVVDYYPSLKSPMDIAGFFNEAKFDINSKTYSLDDIEKKELFNRFNDPRMHFALVCAAKGCPPLLNRAYYAETLDITLDEQTRKALKSPYTFIKTGNNSAQISQIFNWYKSDFVAKYNSIEAFINSYSEANLSSPCNFTYITYDWSLNDIISAIPPNEIIIPPPLEIKPVPKTKRYFRASTLLKQGQLEAKVFNNLYAQQINSNGTIHGASYYTALFNFFYGINPKINAGFQVRYKGVFNEDGSANTPFKAVNFNANNTFRNPESGFTNIQNSSFSHAGPRIRYAPFTNSNTTIEHVFLLPLEKDLSGTANFNDKRIFVDYDNPIFYTEVSNDKAISEYIFVFLSGQLLFENIGDKQFATIYSTPLKSFLTYFKNGFTAYGMVELTPRLRQNFTKTYDFAPYGQTGVGIKYQLLPNLELESLSTFFSSSDLIDNKGKAYTLNFGIRFTNVK